MSGSRHYNPFEGITDEASDPPVRDGDESEGADFEVDQVLQESEKAIQVVLSETGDVAWVPKSVIHTDSEVYEKPEDGKGDGTLIVYTWWAEKAGWL